MRWSVLTDSKNINDNNSHYPVLGFDLIRPGRKVEEMFSRETLKQWLQRRVVAFRDVRSFAYFFARSRLVTLFGEG